MEVTPRAWWVWALLLVTTVAMAARPEIYAIHPDTDIQNHFKGVYGACQIITGKHFGPDVEVWTWSGPKADNEAQVAAALRLEGSKPGPPWEGDADDEDPSFNPDVEDTLIPAEYTPDDPTLLPSRPPSGADAAGVRKASILSASPTVLATSLPEGTAIVWVRNRDGWSLPYLVGAARPYWINTSQVRAGDYFHIVGVAVGRDHVGGRALLRGGKTPIFIDATGSRRSGGWYTDRFIRYIRVPVSTKPGRYEVFFHNNIGGIYGWSFAGAIEVLPTQPVVLPVLIAGEHGVKADGITDDTPAVMALLQKAATAKADVLLPAGVIRITRTVTIPAGITVRGAGREQTVIHGTGFAADAGVLPAPLVTMASHSRLQYLGLDGAVAGTPNADGTLVRLETDATDILLSECALHADSEDPVTDAPLYRYAVWGEGCRQVRISESAIQGTVQVRDADQVEVVKNTITDAHWQGQALALSGARCLVDANVFTQAPGRLALAPLARSVIRLNEIHYTWHGDWAVADDITTAPRAKDRIVRMVTGSTATTMRDQSQKWQPGKWTGAGLMLLEGTGFGQVRRVIGNTADTLTLDRPWHALPDATSRYLLGFFSMENAYSYNYNNTIVPWDFTDNVATVMQYQRNLGAPMRFLGSNLTSAATPNAFYPSWFNRITGSHFNLAGAELRGEQVDGNTLTAPATFGNVLASCILQRPGPPPSGNAVAGIEVGGGQQAKHPGVAWSLLFGNALIGVDLGVRIAPDAMSTYVGNTYENFRIPIVDHGVGTIALPRVNRYYDANDLWTTLDGNNGWNNAPGDFGPPLPYTTGRQ